MNTRSRLINLPNVTFTKEHVNTLSLGPNYAIEKNPKHYINDLIIDTENAVRQMDPKLQGTFRFLAATKTKQILDAGKHHRLHKRYQHNINQIKDILKENNLTVTKTDKNKAMVIINKDAKYPNIHTRKPNHFSEKKIPQKSTKNSYNKPLKNAIP
jgi:hypothetical protein